VHFHLLAAPVPPGDWFPRGKNFTKLCKEYNIMGSSPLIFDVFAKFRAVCNNDWDSSLGYIMMNRSNFGRLLACCNCYMCGIFLTKK